MQFVIGPMTAIRRRFSGGTGRELEWSKLDEAYCWAAYASCLKEVNPFLPPDAFADLADGDKTMRGEKRPTVAEASEMLKRLPQYYPLVPPHTYNPAMCAGRGCLRACMVHLARQGKLQNKFKNRFRKREPWWHKANGD